MTKQQLQKELTKLENKLFRNLGNGGMWDYQEEQELIKLIKKMLSKIED